jgi:hypothetical protein
MKNTKEIGTFNEFWPLYLQDHSSRTSRAFHFAGLALSAVSVVTLLAYGLIFFLALAAVPAMLGAWLGHRLSPRNGWAADEHPDWAIVADLKMFGLALTGRLDRELSALREAPSHPSKPAWSI